MLKRLSLFSFIHCRQGEWGGGCWDHLQVDILLHLQGPEISESSASPASASECIYSGFSSSQMQHSAPSGPDRQLSDSLNGDSTIQLLKLFMQFLTVVQQNGVNSRSMRC